MNVEERRVLLEIREAVGSLMDIVEDAAERVEDAAWKQRVVATLEAHREALGFVKGF